MKKSELRKLIAEYKKIVTSGWMKKQKIAKFIKKQIEQKIK